MPESSSGPRWESPAVDLAGFLLCLLLAWIFAWQAGDLIWSLWLSSLIFGGATLVLGFTGPFWRACAGAGVDGELLWQTGFGLPFSLLIFWGMHLGHAVLLSMFVPLEGIVGDPMQGPPIAQHPLASFALVLGLYWPWLISAGLAERKRLVEAWQIGGIAAQFLRPYLNVLRMHLLIFAFYALQRIGWDGFPTFALVFAVYFFPWRLLRRTPS